MSRKTPGKIMSPRRSPSPPKAAEPAKKAIPTTMVDMVDKAPLSPASIVETPILREVPAAPVVADSSLPKKPETSASTLTAAVPVAAKIEDAPAESSAASASSVAAEAQAKASTMIEENESTAISALALSLHHPDADIARDAATAIGELRDPRGVEPLLAVLNDDNGYFHPVVRAAAAASLGQLGDSRAVDALLITVSDRQAEPSAEAIRALAAIGDSRAVSTLIEVVQNPSGFFLPIARRAAVLALGQFQCDQAAETLRAVSDDAWEDSVIRQAAIDAIQPVSEKNAIA